MIGRISPRRALAVVVATAAGLFVMARASAAPLPFHGSDTGRLRLSWTARPERIETCRVLTAEQLQEREAHMRQRVECDGRFATYALRVAADGQVISESVVRGAGLRHDRPLYLLRDIDLPTGAHHVSISLTRRETTDDDAAAFAAVAPVEVDSGIFAGRSARESDEHARRAKGAIPASLVLDTTLVFAPRQVLLVTFNRDRRALEVRDGMRATP